MTCQEQPLFQKLEYSRSHYFALNTVPNPMCLHIIQGKEVGSREDWRKVGQLDFQIFISKETTTDAEKMTDESLRSACLGHQHRVTGMRHHARLLCGRWGPELRSSHVWQGLALQLIIIGR